MIFRFSFRVFCCFSSASNINSCVSQHVYEQQPVCCFGFASTYRPCLGSPLSSARRLARWGRVRCYERVSTDVSDANSGSRLVRFLGYICGVLSRLRAEPASTRAEETHVASNVFEFAEGVRFVSVLSFFEVIAGSV